MLKNNDIYVGPNKQNVTTTPSGVQIRTQTTYTGAVQAEQPAQRQLTHAQAEWLAEAIRDYWRRKG